MAADNRKLAAITVVKHGLRIGTIVLMVQIAVPFLGGCGKQPEAQPPATARVQGAPIDAPAAKAETPVAPAKATEEMKAAVETAKAPEIAAASPATQASPAANDQATSASQEIASAVATSTTATAPAATDPAAAATTTSASNAAAAPAPLTQPVAAGTPVMLTVEEMAALAKRPVDKEGYLPLTFADVAGFIYKYPELEEATVEPVKEGAEKPVGPTPTSTPLPGADERIPKEIRDLSGRKISMQGFMIPTDVQKGRIKSFVLIRNQMGCCFGVMPMMNEWLHVTMQGDTTCDFLPDVPLLVKGILQVGEEVQEGIVVSIYRMTGEKVDSTGPAVAAGQGGGAPPQGF